jgi:hypothetical protein
MALLDMFKRGAKSAGKNLENYIGGLLGEDLSQLSEEERKQIRRQGMSAVFDAMARGTTPTQGLAGVAQMAGARLEQKRLQGRQQAAEQEMGRITGRLFGGAPAAPADMGEDETGLGTVAIQSQYRQSPQEALARMYGTAAGRDVAQMAPGLLELAQEGTTGRTVGGAVYNPLTGQFSRPPAEKAKRLTPAEVAKEGLPRGTVAEVNEKGELKVIYEPKIAGAAGAKDPQDLRKEVNAQLKPYTEVGDMWAKVRQAGQNPTAANDLALIFGYMKILDPGSVVREGEFANAQNSAGVPDRLRATYNNLLRGERLTEVQRQDFLRSAYGAVQSQVPRVQSVIDYYTDVATSIGVKPESVIRNPLKDAIVPKVTSDADYAKLAPGTLFEDPNGNLRTKPRSK